MVPEQCLFVFRHIFYCILFMLSFCVFVPLAVVFEKYWGYCLLYADRGQFGAVAPCGYTICVPLIFSSLYAGYMFCSYCCKISMYNRLGYMDDTFAEFALTVIMDALAWIFMFVNACLISAGFNEMCWNLFGTLYRCRLGTLNHPVFGRDDNYFLRIKLAEVSAWLSWLFWLFQLIAGVIALFRSGLFPQNADGGGFCDALPCRPHCTCSCRMQVKKREPLPLPGSQPSSRPVSPGVQDI